MLPPNRTRCAPAFSTRSRSTPESDGALYQLYTATLKITDIALQEGEQLVSVAAGDTARWTIGDTESGSGATRRVHVLVKPNRSDLPTNSIIINTDRRTYHLEAHAGSETAAYLAAVSWSYPQEDLLALHRRNAVAEAAAPIASGLDLEHLRFRYEITGDHPPWRPVRAFDDGSKVYLEFPAGIAQGEMPPLFIVGPTGENERGKLPGPRPLLRGRSPVWRRRAALRQRASAGGADQPERWESGPVTSQTDKEPPERLALRPAPRPVTRLSRRALMTIGALAATGIAAATWYALDAGPWLRRGPGPELFNTDHKPQAEGLAGLPRTYADLPQPSSPPPRLGPPLPGDLGRPMAQAALPAPIHPDADAEAARQRQREADQAAASKVFFAVAAKPAATPAQPTTAAAATSEGAQGPTALDPDSAQNQQDREAGVPQSARLAGDLLAPEPANTALALSDHGRHRDCRFPGHRAQVRSSRPGDRSGERKRLRQRNRPDPADPPGQPGDRPRKRERFDSAVAYGQERLLLIWTRLILPDGSSIVLDNLPATDPAGYAGLEDEVDYHTWRLIKGVMLSTVLGISSELAANNGDSNSGNRIIIAARDSADSSANQVGQRLVQKEIALQPTLTVRPGWPLRIVVNRDLLLRPYRG